MELSLFQLANYFLILVLGVLVIRYIYIWYTDKTIGPARWEEQVKQRVIPVGLKQLEKKYPDKVRFFNWWLQIERLKQDQIQGVFAELGVYQGESAEVIHQMDPTREFHLFDTFTGFTASDLAMETGEAATYTPDHFSDTAMQTVVERINGKEKVFTHPGYFPDSAGEFRQQVALANLDADLYNPTRAGLAFFYPLLAPGGVLMVHDYNSKWPGIIRAVDEFVKTIPESPVFISDKHGTVMIIRNK